jgi:hypothetical protein
VPESGTQRPEDRSGRIPANMTRIQPFWADFGGGRLLECESRLRRLKEWRIHLPPKENDLRF